MSPYLCRGPHFKIVMAKKAKLAMTLAVLQVLSLPVLSSVYTEVTTKPVPDNATAETVLAEILKVADPAEEPEVPPVVASDKDLPTFTLNKKKYEVLIPKVNIPGIGLRTAKELAVDKEAQEHLLKIGCLGTVLREV